MAKKKLKRGKLGRISIEKRIKRTVYTKKKSGLFSGRRVARKGERSKVGGIRRESAMGRLLGFSKKRKKRKK